MRTYYTYIMASNKHGTLYIGITNNLARRVIEHQQGLVGGFTNKYKVNKLVYYEHARDMLDAIAREKQLKHWYRAWKIELIESINPTWRDLSDNF